MSQMSDQLRLFDESGGGLPLCHRCELAKGCRNPRMKVGGRGTNSVLLVGEAPGETEDRMGVPFVGKAGQYLRKSLKAIGVDLGDCWLTNAIICRPPRNVMESSYLAACRPALIRTIENLKPRLIVALGKTAIAQLLQDDWTRGFDTLAKWRGWQIPSQRFNAWVGTTYHPSYIIRKGEDELLDRAFIGDLKKAFEVKDSSQDLYPTLDKLKELVLIVTHRDMLSELIEGIAGLDQTDEDSHGANVLAFDYETTALKPEGGGARILCAAFSLNGIGAWAGHIEEMHYDALRRILTNKRILKVGQNLKFEARWSRHLLGCGIEGWHWDTMLAAHQLDNRGGISALDFQAFVRLGIGDYSSHLEKYKQSGSDGLNRMDKVPLTELLMYCGLDALLTYRVMEEQKAELGYEK